MLVVGEHAGRHIADFSAQFQSEFVKMWSRRFGTKRVRANTVYQEYIQHKEHLHMNATRWVTLTEFVKHLGRSGIAHVDETEKGWWIAWIDNSPKALSKRAREETKERSNMDDEGRERAWLNAQIERAKEAGEGDAEASGSGVAKEEEGLKRDETEKVVLALKPKVTTPPESEPTVKPEPISVASSSDDPSTSQPTPPTPSAPTMKIGFNAFKSTPGALKPTGINPLKKNVFKLASSSSSASPAPTEKDDKPRASMSVAERLILEDQERKAKRRRLD